MKRPDGRPLKTKERYGGHSHLTVTVTGQVPRLENHCGEGAGIEVAVEVVRFPLLLFITAVPQAISKLFYEIMACCCQPWVLLLV